jgi:uncharacterized protein YxeA
MKYSSIILASLILIISAGLLSCKKQPTIDEKNFIKIYADMIFMQDTSTSSQLEIKKEVLKRFNVTENDYDKTIKYYNDDPERWQPFFDSVITYIEKMKPNPKKSDVKSSPEQSGSLDKKNP